MRPECNVAPDRTQLPCSQRQPWQRHIRDRSGRRPLAAALAIRRQGSGACARLRTLAAPALARCRRHWHGIAGAHGRPLGKLHPEPQPYLEPLRRIAAHAVAVQHGRGPCCLGFCPHGFREIQSVAKPLRLAPRAGLEGPAGAPGGPKRDGWALCGLRQLPRERGGALAAAQAVRPQQRQRRRALRLRQKRRA